MLRLGMVLLGTALILHGKSKTAPKSDEEDPSQPDDSFPPSATKRSTLGLDTPDAVNPLLIGPPSANVNELLPASGSVFNPNIPGNSAYGVINEAELGAAFRAYRTVLGQAAPGIRREISNVKRFASFHRRLFHKIFG